MSDFERVKYLYCGLDGANLTEIITLEERVKVIA
jgi:hypothetical protein